MKTIQLASEEDQALYQLLLWVTSNELPDKLIKYEEIYEAIFEKL